MSSSSSPLSGNESLSIDVSGLQPADIIVTRNEATQSKVIRYGSCSTYSHAILMLERGKCIEATSKGVNIIPIGEALIHATYGALYRHKAMDANYAAWICHYAEKHIGKPYDYIGALRAGVTTGCRPVSRTLSGVIIQVIDEGIKGNDHESSSFCSELVVNAFEQGCLPIIRGSSQVASPEAVATSHYLRYIKDVVI